MTLADDSTNGDFEPQDGVYVGQFLLRQPLASTYIDLHAEYKPALLAATGTIEDRLVTQVVVSLDKTLVPGLGAVVADRRWGAHPLYAPGREPQPAWARVRPAR